MKLIKKIKIKKLNNAGMTLVEMLVSFVLLSIFMVSASAIIGSITNIYYDVDGSANGLKISNIIHNKIRGELENAKSFESITEVNENGTTVIKFTKSNNSVVSLGYEKVPKAGDTNSTTDDKYYFVERYDEVVSENINEKYNEVAWRFNESAYMGYSVTGLTIVQAGPEYANNIYKVTLTVSSPQFGDYTTERYVKCYYIVP